MTGLTKERLQELAQRDDCVVYEPTHDVVFIPWAASRVRDCVRRIARAAARCRDEAEARSKVAGLTDVAEFEEKYQTMFQRLVQPEFSRNEAHLQIMLSMIEVRARVESGAISESEAQRIISEQAMAGLMRQVQAASGSTLPAEQR